MALDSGRGKEGIMEDNKIQAGQLLENEDVRKFLNLLMDNRPAEGQDFSMVAWQVDNMAGQLAEALRELGEVKAQLARMQEHPAKRFVSSAVKTAGDRLHTADGQMKKIKVHIVDAAKKAVDGFKRIGVKALHKVVSVLGIKKALEHMQKGFSESIRDMKKSIEKIESIGHELRSAGGHMKNAGRAAVGKEQKVVDGGREGRFQSLILAPLRLEKNILTKLNNMALAAIGSMERLEQAAGEKTGLETGRMEEAASLDDVPEAEAGKITEISKGREKPSLLKDIQRGKALAAASPAPVPDKGQKAQVAL